VIALARRARVQLDRGMEVLLACLGAVLLFLAAHLVRRLLAKAGIAVPAIVPAFHFFFYLMAIVAIGVGVAIRDLASAAVKQLPGRRAFGLDPDRISGLVTCAITLLIVAASYSTYRQRLDFTELRRDALAMNQRFPSDVFDWIRRNTAAADVFLCTDDASLYIVAPAGRKVVATNRYFSNPYVDWSARDADRRRMFERLQRGDVRGFSELSDKYGVRFVLISRDRSDAWLRASGMRASDLPPIDVATLGALPGFSVAFRTDRFVIVAAPTPSRPATVLRAGS
jgi:hypothetical protein